MSFNAVDHAVSLSRFASVFLLRVIRFVLRWGVLRSGTQRECTMSCAFLPFFKKKKMWNHLTVLEIIN